MPEVEGIDKLFSALPRKRFGLYRLFGTSQFAHSNYGEEDIYFNRTGYGKASFGNDLFGNIIMLSGIYRTDNVTGKTRYYREPFYITKNPRLPDQQANREKFADAVLFCQSAYYGHGLFGFTLYGFQENQYNKKLACRRMSGYNLCIREYLKSH